MATQLTPTQIINIARVSQYLAGDDVAKGVLWGARKIPTSDRILYMERKAVQWMNNIDPTNSTLQLTSNYLYSICRGYNLNALAITGSGGSVSPVVPGTMPSPYEFVVTGSSFIIDGQSSKSIPTFVGWNLLFIRNNIPQSQVDTGGSWFTWNKSTGILEIVGAAATDELFQLYPY